MATRRVRKLPLCESCYDTFASNRDVIDRLYEVWLWMPDTDERESAHNFMTKMLSEDCHKGPVNEQAIAIVKRQLEIAKSCARGGKADSYLERVLHELTYGPDGPEKIQQREEMEWLRKAKEQLAKTRKVLKDPQAAKSQHAALAQERTSVLS